MSFTFERLDIPGVIVVRPEKHRDDRGSFTEIYRQEEFAAAGIAPMFVQENIVHSSGGVLRGLHYQLPPAAQGKLVGVVQGRIFDVAVDIRQGGPTFGHWVGRELDAEEGEMLWIPPGFAHGYCVLSETADVLYKVTGYYEPTLSRGIRWNDELMAIRLI
tara:strand:+ start:489 stop:968 length:480 start_codon:yes stop_codon:yes gene_type:complete